MLIDLDKWQRKSLNLVKRELGGACDFDSEHIPRPLNAAIRAQIEHAETEDEVRAIFAGVKAWGNGSAPHNPASEDEDVDQLLKMIMVKMLQNGSGGGMPMIKAENMTVTPEVKVDVRPPHVSVRPEIKVEVPEQPRRRSRSSNPMW